MKYDSDIHCRKSIRLKEYDYSSQGMYFVTICSFQRAALFGEIICSKVCLSPAGEIISSVWAQIPQRFTNVDLDLFVVMPNHVHGIIMLTDPVGASLAGARPVEAVAHPHTRRAGTSPAPTLGHIIGSFKSLCTYECRRSRLDIGKLWQRNYYERIIRNEKELMNIREYIINNPDQWDVDEENPAFLQTKV